MAQSEQRIALEDARPEDARLPRVSSTDYAGRIEELLEQTRQSVRDNPVMTLGAAALAGYLLARVLSR